jgi:ABC-type multidrug transport system ATPase subunit
MVHPTNGTGHTFFVLKVTNLGKRFKREWIFRNLTYQFQQGTTYAITGPNGSGKSTLLQILSGHVPPTAGSLAWYIGNTLLPHEQVYRHISIATPYMELIDEFTLQEMVRFHFNLKPIRKGHTTEQVIEALYLTRETNKRIGNFSSGMRQRLKLGLAFFTHSDMLLLDEPGTNLDANAARWYREQLQEASANRLVLIASNQPEEYPKNAVPVQLTDYKPLPVVT